MLVGLTIILTIKESSEEEKQVFFSNITGNLSAMVYAAGLYGILWEPNKLGFTQAGQLVQGLEGGLLNIVRYREHLETFNPHNCYGSYQTLLSSIEKYLKACKKYPNAEVFTSS